MKELAVDCGYTVAGFIDDFNRGAGILGTFDEVRKTHHPTDHVLTMAIGYDDIPARWTVYQEVLKAGYRCPPLVHPAAYVSSKAQVSDGAIIMAGVIVDVRASIGELSVLRIGVVVSHDVIVKQNVFVSPNATLCGFAEVGRDSFVGAGAVVVNNVSVNEAAFIKAGTVFSVTKRAKTSSG